tara:strand:+ start:2883 stop:4196 length:1314 start_codon:yes stop_codon:yes gene_type:complete
MYKIMVLGSGAREHAITRTLFQSKYKKELFCIGGSHNPGIVKLCKDYTVGDYNDPNFVVKYAKAHKIQFVIIGPENPLEAGITNALLESNINVIGPRKELALIESSKTFTRDLQKEFNIPGQPKYRSFSSLSGVEEYFNELENNFVIKYDGLAGGKGVKVFGEQINSIEDGLSFCEDIIKKGGTFLIEEKFIGEEFSLMSFCDGLNIKHMPVVQDHKRAFSGDTGPNTGGMGTYSDANHSLPFLNNSDIESAKKINSLTLKALKSKTGLDYKGILYGGFMAVKGGIKLIEYNARFGDPEAMNVLSILKTDLIDICNSIILGTLDKCEVEFYNKATVCKYAVPDGYPDNPIKNKPINIDDITDLNHIYFASVDFQNEGLIETGSRTIASISINDSIYDAEKNAEQYISSVRGPLFHRSDIGTKKVVDKKIIRMKELRC